jgi:cell division protein FtsL
MMPLRARRLKSLAQALPGWLFLASGLLLLGALTLVPAYEQVRQLRWQQDALQHQHQHLQQITGRYEAFHAALAERDPVALAHVAYRRLGLQPRGMTVLPVRDVPSYGYASRSGGRQPSLQPGLLQSEGDGLDAWLFQPVPRVGHEIAPLLPVDTMLTRLTTGPRRWLVLVAAAMLVAFGLLHHGQRTRRTPVSADTTASRGPDC